MTYVSAQLFLILFVLPLMQTPFLPSLSNIVTPLDPSTPRPPPSFFLFSLSFSSLLTSSLLPAPTTPLSIVITVFASFFSLYFPSRQSFHSCHGGKILEICFQIISGNQLPTRLNLVGLPYTAGSRGLSRCARLPLLTSE
ncbi:unnamed protein product [Tuber melanosporum]|uniref:(Perigord truffle) hypothetical protein n=1 Tax=Tuber melanosporum (strain Mel28) TaxID=656061 RepID=D5GL50_TUBMM|nr:uncharacterized protein GSTUM_00010002001 [Tuber melanosporum]CAZ85243.1 unnamed protein product [Tuber melanosporum]